MDKYFFVGILEDTAKSIKILTDLMGKKRYKIPWINTTNTNRETEFNNLSKSLIENFKKDNELDYLIYNYAKKRLSKKKRRISYT